MQVEDEVITIGGRPWDWTFELVGDEGIVEMTLSYRNGTGQVDLGSMVTIELEASTAIALADALRKAVLAAGRVTW